MQGDTWDAAVYAAASGFQTSEAEELLRRLQPRAGERVLDIGCGDGRVTVMISSAGASAVGLDRSLVMARSASEKGVTTVVGDAVALPFADGTFDAVLSNAALHWVSDHYAAVHEIARVLAPGGRMAIRLGGAGNQWRSITEMMRTLGRAPYAAYRPRGMRPPWRMGDPSEWMAALVDAGMLVQELGLVPSRSGWEDAGQMKAWLMSVAHPILSLLPESLQARFLDEVTERVWQGFDPAGEFVRLQVEAVHPGSADASPNHRR
ncbi:MAG: methyltransferase domain-containing protein [Actinomycetota bacterium]|nr:methyltransferase domain-containing protein [Actinomycetota bacterium]